MNFGGRYSVGFYFAVCLAATPAPVYAQLVSVKSLSADMTAQMVATAVKCAKSEKLTLVIVDRNQQTLVSFRGPMAAVSTVDLARRKAAAAAQFGKPTGNSAPAEVAATTGSATMDQLTAIVRDINATAHNIENSSSTVTLGGAEPIKVGDETIAAIALSGTGPTEDVCAKEAIAAIQDRLK